MITVAIVDDDLLFAESLGEALSARGISVLATCDSIAECLARHAAEPDVLIVDMLLDGSLDGPTIREQWRRTHDRAGRVGHPAGLRDTGSLRIQPNGPLDQGCWT